MMLLLAVFFGFIVFSLIALIVMNNIADKYLHGDYIRLDEKGDEEEGFVKKMCERITLMGMERGKKKM